ncbi:unnamed protein product [Arabidopsis arenosa]|uniref:RBR-type E3 ubiquitin transferase n=1 Tax=Arabidopsis arenosa TaxID=38785 RepID=A0A8S2ACQ3_ARAAE|nr:unnamed protein product [Arabidopsis arenosa]
MIRFAYKLAREAIVSDITRLVNRPRQAKATRKRTCSICLDDDINANQMFSIDKCRHKFCYECMKQHIEVRLLEGSVIRCPHYSCKCKLSFGSCVNLLSPKLRNMWQKRIKEDSIPVKQRIYCPNPRCSVLMSVNELSKSTKEAGVRRYFSKSTNEARVRRYCLECGQVFCINCKVKWHSNLSCDDYKRLGPNPTADDIKLKVLANQKMWRQCEKCKHMIELSEGCIKVTCRCGHKFCYECGAKAGGCRHALFHMYLPMQQQSPLPPRPPLLPLPPMEHPPVWEDSLAGFGVAICSQEDDSVLFQMKRSILNSTITVLEAEVMALKRGLTEAVSLGINHISICCDHYQIYELVMGRSAPEHENITLLMDDVHRIRQQLTSSIPVLMTGNQARVAYKRAMETVASEISISMPATCCICLDDDFEAKKMFSVTLCGHKFCIECLEQDIEVGLLEGNVIRCPYDGCKSKLILRSCAHLLTPKVREMWEQRIKEDSIPVWDRFYCPKPKCSAIMSKTELFESTEEDGYMRCCVKCNKPFCINCKVTWHSNLSCEDFKRLGPNPTAMWRQCRKCQDMIEPSIERINVTCRYHLKSYSAAVYINLMGI